MTQESIRRAVAATTPPPSNEMQQLKPFVGHWAMEGRQYDSPFGPAARIRATQTYEWLQGEHFLIHRFDGHVGSSEAACVEIIGYETSKLAYRYRTFYNNGRTAEWLGREHDDAWVLTGVWQMPNGSFTVRCTTQFDEDQHAMTGLWEYSTDQSKWKIFWDVKAQRATGRGR
jgi:Protein of unknown function (DUF1579)